MTAVEPAGGPPGAPVTLRGTGLASATGVRFGAVRSPVVDATDTLVRTAVPAGRHLGAPRGDDPGGLGHRPRAVHGGVTGPSSGPSSGQWSCQTS
ncbi:IPT/TIG domain-containing protein [Actinomadura madurae]|uniref:IPT/TIG domain-containing protein n=1 Tax=Actinomadura madurae TaxID=1993 RepID=UPI003556815B